MCKITLVQEGDALTHVADQLVPGGEETLSSCDTKRVFSTCCSAQSHDDSWKTGEARQFADCIRRR